MRPITIALVILAALALPAFLGQTVAVAAGTGDATQNLMQDYPGVRVWSVDTRTYFYGKPMSIGDTPVVHRFEFFHSGDMSICFGMSWIQLD